MNISNLDKALEFAIDRIIEDTSKRGFDSVLGQVDNCVSVSVFAAKILSLLGYPALPVEACAQLFASSLGSFVPCVGTNIPKTRDWSGHMVVLLPRENRIVDFSLSFQGEPAKSAIGWLLQSDQKPINRVYYFPAAIPPLGACNIKIESVFEGGKISWLLFQSSDAWRNIGWDIGELEEFAETTVNKYEKNTSEKL